MGKKKKIEKKLQNSGIVKDSGKKKNLISALKILTIFF